MVSATLTGLVSVGSENAFLKRRYGKRKTRSWAYRPSDESYPRTRLDRSRIHETGLARNILTPTPLMVLYVCYMYQYLALQSPEIGSWTDWEVSLNEQ